MTTGATSQVWDVRVRDARFVLRVAVPGQGTWAGYESDVGIRRRLVELGAPVAAPVATNRDADIDLGTAWCLDERVEGAPGENGGLPRRACIEIGELLAVLHSLPVEGYGLLEDRRDWLKGRRGDPVAGLASRLEIGWPFCESALADHPAARAAPGLVSSLVNVEGRILELLKKPSRSICHTDLHAGQLLLHNGRLAALLDFGDAVAGWPAWDIASFGYFHGWALAGDLLAGYAESSDEKQVLLDSARHFAIVIALHHAARSTLLDQPQRMHGAVRYLHDELPHGG